MRNEKAAKVLAEALAKSEAMGDGVFANGRDMAAFYNAFTKLTAEPMGRTRAIALNGRLESIKLEVEDYSEQLLASVLELGIMSEADFKDGLAKINALELKDRGVLKTLIYNMEAFIKEIENCFKNIEIYSEQEQEELVAWGNSLAPAFAHLFLKEVA